MGEVTEETRGTAAEKEKDERIDKLRQMFVEQYAENIQKGIYDDRDLNKLKNDDAYVMCFIEDRDKLEDSLAMVHESLKWRLEIGINDFTEDHFDKWMWELGAIFFHKTDKDGQKILFVKVKEYRKDLNMLPIVKKFFALALEQAALSAPGEKVVLLFDMLDTGFANLDMELIKYCLTCFKFYFPGLLAYILVFELPWIFNAAWKVIKTWLNQKAVEKIKFVNKLDIQEYINKDQLMEHMGGTDKYQYKYDAAVQKGFVEDGKISRTGAKKRVTFADQDHAIYRSFSSDSIKEETNSKPNSCGRHQNKNRSAMQATHSRMIKMNRDENSFIGRLLTISPAEELQFAFEEEGKESCDSISLTNSLPYPIAYKVKTTSPEKYRVRPSSGIVKPGSCVEVTVYLHNTYQNTITKDKFLVMAIELTEDCPPNVAELWKTVSRDNIMEHRLRCTHFSKSEDNLELAWKPDYNEMAQEVAKMSSVVDELSSSIKSLQRSVKVLLFFQVVVLVLVSCLIYHIYRNTQPKYCNF